MSLFSVTCVTLVEPYLTQAPQWPKQGCHILAQYDDATIIVYQAFNAEIGRYAVAHQQLGGAFNYHRMSWIKTSFLWLMHRSGWGTKEDQQVTLALRLPRSFFDTMLRQAVPSSWDRSSFAAREAWADAARRSEVRTQWDPDYDPGGRRLSRRALQMGLRGQTLEAFGRRELLEVLDVSEFVAEQRRRLAGEGMSGLLTPREAVYQPDPSESVK